MQIKQKIKLESQKLIGNQKKKTNQTLTNSQLMKLSKEYNKDKKSIM